MYWPTHRPKWKATTPVPDIYKEVIMKVIIAILLVLGLCSAVYAFCYIDYSCVSRCMTNGGLINYCTNLCTVCH